MNNVASPCLDPARVSSLFFCVLTDESQSQPYLQEAEVWLRNNKRKQVWMSVHNWKQLSSSIFSLYVSTLASLSYTQFWHTDQFGSWLPAATAQLASPATWAFCLWIFLLFPSRVRILENLFAVSKQRYLCPALFLRKCTFCNKLLGLAFL